MKLILVVSGILLMTANAVIAQKKEDAKANPVNSGLVSGLAFRNIGPAMASGRISDIAVNPDNPSEYYLAVASGGVWKTTNHGNTYSPIFDHQGSYSIGCITIDPNNTSTIWVGTGENNNQRSVAYGDGVYRSDDGGSTWQNMGLKSSEHISKIIVDPRNSDVVYVAAYGPLWAAGGERGTYKTTDGGKTWKQIHFISENSGTADLVMDPKNPDILYESVHQRRRHVFTYIGGGDESGVFKTTDGGTTWTQLKNGLPSSNLGRVGLAVSPADPNYVYAICEAENGQQGFYRSTNKGASFEKRSAYETSGNYYQEIICDPYDVNKVFSMDTWLHHTEDGGRTFKGTGENDKHVDNHCIWIDPADTRHWLVGCDGGLYETWDHAAHWEFKQNLPVTQFYKVALDNDYPFYNVYGGTQDNNSMGGPSRTINNAGILNSDWFITNGGDGFESQVDPTDANIVYAQAQYGWLVRYDKQSGESIGIQPMPGKGEAAYRWNWDAPLVISNHNNQRLYFAANKVFKSDDRGNTWQVISPDLTRQLDRNKMEVMGEIQSPDAVMKNKSTSIFGNITAMDESPKNEKILYVGTDDGLIQITRDGGATWNKKDNFPGIPAMTYVNQVVASKHDENVVFAVFNNHKQGDFKPYILKSTNTGDSWVSITGDLPARGTVYCIAQDHVNPDLLFAGTEFGCFFTINGGVNWIQLKAGLPTIAIKDMAIQTRENDLVLASFGRGFYVLDDYSPLRHLSTESLDKKALIFPIRTSLEYIETSPLGLTGRSSQGSGFYLADNPPFGATFTYYVKEVPQSPKAIRQADEKKKREAGEDIHYPTYEEFVAEDNYQDPFLIFVIRDAQGNEVNRIKTGASTGINRVTWNLRYPTTTPVELNKQAPGRYSYPDEGPLALPGTYTVEIHLSTNGILEKVADPVSFNVKALENSSLARQSDEILAFKKELSELRRSFRGTASEFEELRTTLSYIKTAIAQYPNADMSLMKEVAAIEDLAELTYIQMWGDYHKSGRDEETGPSTGDRIEGIVGQCWYSTSNVTTTQKDQFVLAKEEYGTIRKNVDEIKARVEALEVKLDSFGVPYTPNRSNWKQD
ncbi:MAG: glycosyl hydrolase [Bacteroidetes bacterium]|nr:glycosyl hydrolase [Bacteroidota bacterium]